MKQLKRMKQLKHMKHLKHIWQIYSTQIKAADKKEYKPKEKVTVTINAPANRNLSMAVVDAGIVPEQADDMVSYLRLQSEVKGNIEHARRYFDTTNINRFKQLDLLLMTQGWRDFLWRRLADTAIHISYAAENGVNVSGKVEDEVNHNPMPNINVSLYADAAKGNKIFSASTDAAGRFSISNLMLYGKQNVKLASVNDKGEKRGSFLVDAVVAMPVRRDVNRTAAKITFDSISMAAITNRFATMQKANLKGITKLKEVVIKDSKVKPVVLRNGINYMPWGPVQSLIITAKDKAFKTLNWYMLQNVEGAMESTNQNIPGICFHGDGKKIVYPKILINGYEPFDINRSQYFDMPIDKFKKIEIVKVIENLYPFPIKFLLYLTMNDDYLTDNPGSLSIDVYGYYQARTFYQPPPNTKPQLADYRTTIHWEPNIKTDAAGKAVVSFYNGIAASKVRLVVEGLTDKGIPLMTSMVYEIR